MDKEIDDIVELIADVLCGIDKSPMDLKVMGKFSVLSSMLHKFGMAMNDMSFGERTKYGVWYEKLYKEADVLVADLKKFMSELPKKEVVKDVEEDVEPEDTLGIRFLGKGTEE